MPDAAAPPPRLGILNGVGAAGAAGVRLPRALSAITAAPSTPNHAAVPAHRQAGGRAAKAPPPLPPGEALQSWSQSPRRMAPTRTDGSYRD